MGRESFALYILKLLLLMLIVALLAMVYWSSNAVESRVIQVEKKLSKLEKRIEQISCVDPTSQITSPRPQLAFPTENNLLQLDTFYAETLPKLLGPHFQPGTLWQDAFLGRPQNLHPFTNWAHISHFYGKCVPTLCDSMFGYSELYTPALANHVEERAREDGQGTEYWITLRDDLFWQPLNPSLFPDSLELAPWFLEKHPVTAFDVLFFHLVASNPYNQEPKATIHREFFSDLEELRAVDDRTLVVRWASKKIDNRWLHNYYATNFTLALKPLPLFVYLYYPDGTRIVDNLDEVKTSSTFAQVFQEHWAKNYVVSVGPYQFQGMTTEGLTLKRVVDFPLEEQALFREWYTSFRNSMESIWTDFKAGKLKTYNLSPLQLTEWERFKETKEYQEQKKQGDAILELDYIDNSYFYIAWNEKQPLFTSKKVRQALTLAVDRTRIIQEILNGQAVQTIGPIHPDSPNYNASITPWPFDPEEAKRLLEEEGFFDRKGNGVLEKETPSGPLPFSFSMIYYTKNESTRSIVDFVAGQLKEIGIQCHPNGLDLADLSAKVDGKEYDALFLGWALGQPPEDLSQIWSSKAADQKGSSNSFSFKNAHVDAIIEQLRYEDDPEKRKQLYFTFQEILHQEQPYIFLYVPKVRLLYREGVKNVFIPRREQELLPGATIGQPQSQIYWVPPQDD